MNDKCLEANGLTAWKTENCRGLFFRECKKHHTDIIIANSSLCISVTAL